MEPSPSQTPTLTEALSREQLKSASIRGGLLMVLTQGGGQIFRLIVTAVLARQLVPADYGLVAMAAAILAAAAVFRDLGLSRATIRWAELKDVQVNSLFWINVGFGAVVALIGVCAAPWVAEFYGDPRLTSVTAALSLSFLLSGLSAQHNALLVRNLKFSAQARVQVVSMLLSGLLAIALAAQGVGYWALVAQMLAGDVVSTLLTWTYSPWRPGRPRVEASVKPMLSFGGYLIVFGVMNYLASYLYAILIGRWMGPTPLGQYGRGDTVGKTFLGYVLQPIGNVAEPSLARLQYQPDNYESYYLRLAQIIAMVSLPLGAGFIVLGPDLVRVLLGPQWEQAGRILSLLAVGLALYPICNTSGWLYLSRGRARQMMLWGIGGWSFMLAATLAGLPWGVEGVAAASSAAFVLITPPCMWFAFRGTRLTLGSLWRRCSPALLGAMIAAAATAGLHQFLETQSVWLRLPASALTLGLVYAILLMTVLGQRGMILELLAQIRASLARRTA
jgi:PST family polysaccharide transporter